MITSASNQQIKNISALIKKAKERRNQGCFVVEGRKMCLEAPKDRIIATYVSESFAKESPLVSEIKGSYEIGADNIFKSITDTQTPQGILSIVKMPEYSVDSLLDGDRTHLLILDSIQDPGNLGTMLRTGEGAGEATGDSGRKRDRSNRGGRGKNSRGDSGQGTAPFFSGQSSKSNEGRNNTSIQYG